MAVHPVALVAVVTGAEIDAFDAVYRDDVTEQRARVGALFGDSGRRGCARARAVLFVLGLLGEAFDFADAEAIFDNAFEKGVCSTPGTSFDL